MNIIQIYYVKLYNFGTYLIIENILINNKINPLNFSPLVMVIYGFLKLRQVHQKDHS